MWDLLSPPVIISSLAALAALVWRRRAAPSPSTLPVGRWTANLLAVVGLVCGESTRTYVLTILGRAEAPAIESTAAPPDPPAEPSVRPLAMVRQLRRDPAHERASGAGAES